MRVLTIFYLVRHGETVWNKEQRLQGWLDSPLSSEGIVRAKKLGDHLKDVPFVAAFCSSSERAKETLHYLVHDEKMPIYYIDNLREIHLGNWQGMTIDEIRKNDRFEYELYTDYPGQFIATHTESFGAVTERAMYALKSIANQYPKDTVLIVSHGVTIKCIVNAILDRSMEQLWTPPIIEDTSVTILEVTDEQWEVKEISSLMHLL